MSEPGRSAIGTWSGGRFLHFGEAIDEDRLAALLRPGGGIETVLTADAYGQGEADRLLGRALAGVPREDYSLVGAVGHDFYEGERNGPKGFPRFTDPGLRGPDEYAGYLRMATEASLERIGASSLRPVAAPQPRPHRLLQRGRLGRDGGAARGRADGADRRRARPRQRLHPRPDRLPRALRRPHRLGDGHPQPARALAGRALPRRRRPPRGQGPDPRRRLRRPLLGRPATGDGAGPDRPPLFPARRLDRGRGARSWSGCCPSPSAPA